jgi:hypothetical protein
MILYLTTLKNCIVRCATGTIEPLRLVNTWEHLAGIRPSTEGLDSNKQKITNKY